MSQVHDNEILSYEVNYEAEQIIMHTRYDSRQLLEHTDIVFSGVLCHWFEGELPGSIILDINANGIPSFIKENTELLNKQKNYGWPKMYDTLEELESTLTAEQYQYFVISSSYGLNGWVVAKSCDIDVRVIHDSRSV